VGVDDYDVGEDVVVEEVSDVAEFEELDFFLGGEFLVSHMNLKLIL